MRIIPFDTLTPTPWANGGGVTREIAAERDADGILWRLSLAEVEADGPFSAYPGLLRVLTVVQGAGMDLETPRGVLVARPLAPVRFSGATPVTGRLHRGPIRDLNLMLREGLFSGGVSLLEGPAPVSGGLLMVHVAFGRARLGDRLLETGDTVIAPQAEVRPEAGARLLRIDIHSRN